jgi:type II restriction/modification system DNA methylase subunit YeeA
LNKLCWPNDVEQKFCRKNLVNLKEKKEKFYQKSCLTSLGLTMNKKLYWKKS